MTFAPEAVTQSGSGLVFINYYDPGVSAAYRDAILTAEHQLQSDFTNPVTIGVEYGLQPLGPNVAATNNFATVPVSYAALATALGAHAATPAQQAAVAGLPATDPSSGKGFMVPIGEANILGLTPQTNFQNLTIALNSNVPWTFGQDAVGALQHELTEGAFGRIASLGVSDPQWAPLDLFRFTANGVRDVTGGSDGLATYFGVDSAQVSTLPYHAGVNAQGVWDGADLGDWENSVAGDAFGDAGAGMPGSLSATDLQVLQVLGWNNSPFTPAPEPLATSLSDTSHPFGQLAAGATASGALNQAGAREWFQVSLQEGQTYTIRETGQAGGGGTLADPYLRLHDFAGDLLAANDDIVAGANPDSQIVFTAPASGTYYVEAGAELDAYAGSYTLQLNTDGTAPQDIGTAGSDVLVAAPGGDSIAGGAGPDTISGATGPDTLFGGSGDDSITGGTGFDQVNGNLGQDTIVGRSRTGDWLLGGQGNDSITAAASSGHNILNGNLGQDTLVGGAGGDSLRGGQGDDLITAGSGPSWLSGDLGHDTLIAGAGADTFHAGGGQDLVLGFDTGLGDRVQVDAGAAYTVTQAGSDVHIDLASGGELVLQNVQLSALPPGWIV